MNKKLPTADMVNELAGASVFFQPTAKGASQRDTQPVSPSNQLHVAQAQTPAASIEKERNHDTMVSSNHDTVQPRDHASGKSTNQPAKVQSMHPLATSSSHSKEAPEMLEEVRKMVRQLGKEAATHRFAAEEKHAIADLVYTYHRQGYKTSENEITRIAVNWLLLDFEERGEQSVLARMLELLHS
jgi:hypothetical protein